MIRYDPSGNFDTKIPEDRREGVTLDPQAGPEVVVFEDVSVPLSTPDSEVLLLFDGGVEGYAVLARATREELINLDEREIDPAVQTAINNVNKRVAQVEARVSALEADEEAGDVGQTKIEDEEGNVEMVDIASQFVAGVIEDYTN